MRLSPPPALLRLALLAAAARSAAAQTCGAAPSYSSLGGGSTSCCAPAQLLQANPSGAPGCAPLAAAVNGPVDVTFALSLRQSEGLGALAVSGGTAFTGDALGNANAATILGAPASLTVTGAALPAPGGAGGASVSAWVKCGAPGNTAAQTQSTVVQWASPSSAGSASQRLGLQATSGGLAGTTGAISQALSSTSVNAARSGVVARDGTLYISSTSGNKIVKVAIGSGALATPLIGSGTAGKVDGVGTSATLTTPAGIVLSQDQNTLYWCEYGGSFSVRMANLSALQTSTFVGSGSATYAEGVGTGAGFVYPYALDIDYARNIMYVADASGYRLRAVNMATRQTSTLVGSGANGHADGTGVACTLYPYSVTVQQATGNIFVADATNHNVRVVTPGGVCSTLAGVGALSTTISGYIEGLGTNARFNAPRATALDIFGNLLVADQGNNKIRMVTQCGAVTSLTGLPNVASASGDAGNGGPLSLATMNTPYGLTVDARTNQLYVFEQGSSIVRNITLPSPTLNPTCDGSWHSIVQTFSGGATNFSGGANPQLMRTFMDGALLSAAAVSLDMSGTNLTALVLGASGEAGRMGYFNGAVSDVRVFGRALTCAEAQQLALPPLQPPAGGTVTPAAITPGVTSAVFTCNVGFAGLRSTYSKNVVGDQSWSYSPGPPSCTACPANTFANGLVCSSMATACGALPTYSLGGATSGCCPRPASAPSAAGAGCSPNGTSSAVVGPADTAFAYSGTAAEGLGGLAHSAAGIGFQNDRYNSPISALQLGTGGQVLASGTALAAALPAPGAAASISANVNCALVGAASASNMTAVEWAQPSPSDSGVRFALSVTGAANGAPLVGTASTPVTSTAALTAPKQGVFDKQGLGNFYFVWGNYLGVQAGPSGAYTTLLGSGTAARVDGVGTSASLNAPTGIAISADSSTIYWAEAVNGMVRQASLATLQASTFVGTGGPNYQEGIGTAAAFVAPYCLDIDYARNIMYVGDTTGARVRTVNMATRQTGTLAGTGLVGNADGAGTSCTLTLPYGVAVQQSSGNVFVSDGTGNKIRMITPAGVCSTFAGPSGNLNGAAGAIDAQGTNALFSYPRGIAFDGNGNLFVADSSNNKVRKITSYGFVSSVTGAANTPGAATANGGNGGALTAVTFNLPFSVGVDPNGNVWVVESTGAVVRMLAFTQAPSALLPVCDGLWHSVSQTFSGGGGSTQTVRTYIDGYLASNAQLAVAMTGSTATPLAIGVSGEGAASNAATQFVGLLSDVRIFARALVTSEAVNLATAAVPTFAGATFSPARALGVTLYTYSCLPGYQGPVGQTFAQQPDNSWQLSGPATCTPCPVNSFATASPATGSITCTPCTSIDPHGVAPQAASTSCSCMSNYYLTGSGSSYSCGACPAGSTSSGATGSCTCNSNFVAAGAGASQQCVCSYPQVTFGLGASQICYTQCAAGTYSTAPGATCQTCPANSVSDLAASTCTCATNSTWNGQTGTGLACLACPSDAVSAGGSSATCTCLGFWAHYDAPSNTCITPASPTSSVTPSATPTGTPTTTASLSPSPSTTMSSTPTPTASITSTPSPTPSVTPVADVKVGFAFSIVPSAGSGVPLRPSDILHYPAILQAISQSFATLLDVLPGQVQVVNVTDRATGAFLSPASRRLGGPGSQGVLVAVAVNLGKAPTELETDNIQTALSGATTAAGTPLPAAAGSAAGSPLAAAAAAISAAVGSATNIAPSTFVTSAPSGVTVANSPFLSATVVSQGGGSGGSSAGGAGAIAGGIIAAISLACLIWGARSWSKHGQACTADRHAHFSIIPNSPELCPPPAPPHPSNPHSARAAATARRSSSTAARSARTPRRLLAPSPTPRLSSRHPPPPPPPPRPTRITRSSARLSSPPSPQSRSLRALTRPSSCAGSPLVSKRLSARASPPRPRPRRRRARSRRSSASCPRQRKPTTRTRWPSCGASWRPRARPLPPRRHHCRRRRSGRRTALSTRSRRPPSESPLSHWQRSNPIYFRRARRLGK